MVQKVNGFLQQGIWFERDTSFLTLEATGGTPFSMPTSIRQGPLAGGGTAEAVMGILQTRGTVLGYTRESDTVAHYMFGHAAGYFTDTPGDEAAPPTGTQPDVLAELKAQLDDLPGVTWTITVYQGFKGAPYTGENYRYGPGAPSEENVYPFDAGNPPTGAPADEDPIVEGP